jgi:hypothetical protein
MAAFPVVVAVAVLVLVLVLVGVFENRARHAPSFKPTTVCTVCKREHR